MRGGPGDEATATVSACKHHKDRNAGQDMQPLKLGWLV